MDSHSASFDFGANMDFGSAFATPQQQQAFMKPLEDNTSTFFFGDEGIDTTTGFDQTFDALNPALLSTPHDMQQTLSMDNTSESASHWDGNTPLIPNMNTFPHTPAQSFDSLCQQPNAFGKRPLQLDVQDFPQAKRHEAGDFELFPSFHIESQITPPSTIAEGLSDEAADVCAMWFHKYNVLPSDRHIDSLSQLTSESTDAIRSWFGQVLKQGMGSNQSDSAYKSQTALIQQQESFWNDPYATAPAPIQPSPLELPLQQIEEINTPDLSFSHDNTTVVQSATSLRGGKKCCTPTDDPERLGRDPNKIYQCTRKCGKRYGRKFDWKRNEEEGYPCKSWVCTLCTNDAVENVKPCFRKYHFVQHFRNIHPGLNADDYMEASVVTSETEFPRKCGFCRHRFSTRQERINHIGEHFKQGKCMLDWRDEDDDGNSHGSDDGDDDDEDRPSGDGFDGSAPPYPPPELDPRGGSGPKDFGSGGSSGSGTEPPHGGFFQFQLSQGESQLYCAVQQSRPSTIQRDPQQSTTSSESGKSTIEQCSSYTKHVSAEGDNKAVVARDAFTQSVMDEVCEQVEIADQRTYAVDALQPEPRSDEGYIKIDGFINSIATIPKSTERLQQVLSDEHRLDLLGGSKVTARQSLLEVPASTHSFSSVKLLGAGGFSTVDEVVHLATGLRIVRKTLKNRTQTAIEELRKEASVLRKLRHPHISRFHEESTRGDRMSMLLSPIAETTLALWLEQSATQKPANLAETITKMFGCLAASVRYLHEQRPIVKHMDIKPQNILIIEGDQEFPHVVLTDFGISSSDELCDEQAKPLTRQYVAPEVLEGFTRKAAADIWSLGCVFAEMASVPFSQDNTAWLAFRKEFSGRTGKYYWQDVEGLQDRLSAFLDTAKTLAEQTVVCTLQTMLRHEPDERPDAASLSMIFTPAPCCLTWPNDKAIFPAPHEELGALEMFSRNDGMNAHVQPHVQGESLVQASVSLSSARLWLEECSHTHDACRHQLSSDAKILPTRLVDISSAFRDDSYVRIVDSTSLEPSTDYVALSDVWSRSQPLLSSETQSTFYTQLPLQTQPRKFQDALSVAQSLGYSYMWIDSLCVLQDSEQDKQRECKRMASVFRNAALTIVFGQLGDSIPIPSPGGNSGGSHQLLPASTFTTPGFAWDTRAWALQDRLLSRRFLHLGAQMYWECNSLKASQALPRGLPPLLWEKVHTRSDTTSASPRRSKSRARYETAVQLRLHERASREKYCACPLSSHARSTEKNTTQNLQDDRDTLTHKSGDSLSPLSEIDAQNAHITDGSDTSPCSSSGSKPCQSSDLPESFDQLHNGHGTSHAWSVEHPVEHRTTGLNMVGTSGASLTSNANDLAYLDGSYPSIIERSMNGDNNGGMGS